MKTEVIIVLPHQHQKGKDVILRHHPNKHFMPGKMIKMHCKFFELL